MTKDPYNQADDFADRDMNARHDAANAAERAGLFNDFGDNAEAISRLADMNTSLPRNKPPSVDIQTATFRRIQDSRQKLAETIEACESLDKRLRSDLAFQLKLVDTTSHGCAALSGKSFEYIASQFRNAVAKSHPGKNMNELIANELELTWIERDLQDLAAELRFLRSL